MPAFAIAMAALVVGFDQLVQTWFGTIGVVGVALVAVGAKSRNITCSCMGAAVLAVLVAQAT
jgi:hypothetical protein